MDNRKLDKIIQELKNYDGPGFRKEVIKKYYTKEAFAKIESSKY